MKTTVDQEWLTPKQVQELLGIGSTKCYEILQSGELPAIRVGRALRVHRRDIDAWAERNRYIAQALWPVPLNRCFSKRL